MNTPHQIILTALSKMEEGEKNVTPGPWVQDRHEVWNKGATASVCDAYRDMESEDGEFTDASFIASSRTQIPLLRELLKQACEALEYHADLSFSNGNVAEEALSNIAQKLTRGDHRAVVRRGE